MFPVPAQLKQQKEKKLTLWASAHL
jgi:hypothetical protein